MSSEQQTRQRQSRRGPAEDATALGVEAHRHLRARDYGAARPILERALALDPDSAMLAHAKAHLCVETGAFAEGATYLRAYLGGHDPFAGVNVHTAWHLASCELELGCPAAALDWHRRVVAPTLCPQTFSSAAGLLWRLEVRGHKADVRRADWATLRPEALRQAGASPLDDLAAALVFLGAGDDRHLTDLLERLGGARADPVATEVLRPLIHGMHAFRRGEPAAAADLLAPVVPQLGRLSEFPDQLSVVYDTLAAARAAVQAEAAPASPRPGS